MQRVTVSSSNIASVGYDATRQTLEIEFNSGGIYRYYRVPQDVYDALMAASSHGLYFYRSIKEYYRYEKIQ